MRSSVMPLFILTEAAKLFDGNEATVRQLGRVLKENGIENGSGSALIDYRTSGDRLKLEPVFLSLINRL